MGSNVDNKNDALTVVVNDKTTYMALLRSLRENLERKHGEGQTHSKRREAVQTQKNSTMNSSAFKELVVKFLDGEDKRPS